jgi:hypothetical protein
MNRKHQRLIPAPAPGGARADHIARIERALVLAAYIVASPGNNVYAPSIDRLEKELEAARKADPAARANAILDRYLRPVPGKPALPPAPQD